MNLRGKAGRAIFQNADFWKELSKPFNVEQKLWEAVFTLALLKTRLNFFCGRMDGNEI